MSHLEVALGDIHLEVIALHRTAGSIVGTMAVPDGRVSGWNVPINSINQISPIAAA